MSVQPEESRPLDWMDSSGVRHLLRTFKIAIHPSKLILALGAICLTLIWGIVLDRIWTATGNGIHENAIADYIENRERETPADAMTAGVFAVFLEHELSCIRDAIESVRYGRIIGAVQPGAHITIPSTTDVRYPLRGAFANLVLMGRGFVWMVTHHLLHAVLFFIVFLLIWAFFGGAICRLTALQFGRDEAPTIKQALLFTWQKLFGNFFMAPIVPLLICFGVGLALVVGGLVLRIPWFGDAVVALVFFLALIGGFVITLVAVGTVAAGSLFLPTVAVEGSDCFDAISRSFSYFFGRPLRLIWYALIAVVYGSFCWLIVKFIIWLTLASTHLFVDLGSGDKLSLVWTEPTMETLHQFTTDTGDGRWRFLWGGVLGLWILPLRGLVWAFLASFYLTGSTIVYFLLRRDVDETDLGEVFVEEEEKPAVTPPAETPAASEEKEIAAVAPAEPTTQEQAPDEQAEVDEREPSEAEGPPSNQDDSGAPPSDTSEDRREGE